MRLKYFASVISLSVVLSLLFVGISYAQNTVTDPGSGFKISPVRQDVDLDRGETETYFIELENVTDVTQTATAVVNDFGPSENESGTPQLLVGNLAKEDWPYSIKSFVLPVDSVDIEAGGTVTLPVTISIPENAVPGAYYGVIRFISGAGEGEEPGNVSLNASVGTIYLINVPGETVELLSLEQVAASNEEGKLGSLFSSPPEFISIRLRNDGNTYVQPFGNVIVTDWTGNVVFEYDINNTLPPGNILPDSIRRFDDAIDGIGAFGRYTIEVNVAYGDGGSIIHATAAFWVVPWLTIGIIALGVAGLAYLSTRGIRRYNEMIVRRNKNSRRRS